MWPGPSLLQGSNVPSTLRRYASNCIDRRPVIHERRSITHRWRCRLSHILLQKYSKCYIFLLIMDSPEELTPRDLHFFRASALSWPLSQSVCPSVRPSVRSSVRDVPVLDENGLTCCYSFFSPYGSPIILVSSTSNIFINFRRSHPLRGGGDKYKCSIKFRDLLPISRYISQTIQDSAIITMEGE